VDSTAIFAGIGAVFTAAIGMALVMREFRNREHNAARQEVDELTADLYRSDQSYIDLRRYAANLRVQLADLGVETPAAPAPPDHHPIAVNERRHGWRRR